MRNLLNNSYVFNHSQGITNRKSGQIHFAHESLSKNHAGWAIVLLFATLTLQPAVSDFYGRQTFYF